MCGLVGLINGTSKREQEDRNYLNWAFMYLLILSEQRGPYATGISWLKTDGSHEIFKRPMSASCFIKEKQFIDVMSEVDDNTTWLAGHTRWPTRGSIRNADDNHPLTSKSEPKVILTHNGTIFNADMLFRRLNLPRQGNVDSEIIFRMADDTLKNGCIDIPAFKKRLALCRGLISAVMASKYDPKTIVIIKGNMPLELAYHPKHNAIIYASDPAYLEIVFPPETGWQRIQTQPMSIMSFDVDNLPNFKSTPLVLVQ